MPRPISDIPDILDKECKNLTGGRFGDYFTKNTGRTFDELVLTSDRMRFEPTDIVAIEMLSVSLHPAGVHKLLLDRHFAAECSDLLHQIPADVSLADVGPEVVGPQSPAQQLWNLLRGNVAGVHSGGTVLYKLMAAKRPQLFPIWDTRVARVVDKTDGLWWEPIRSLLSDRATRDRAIKATAEAPSHVTLLRRVDVALWRYGNTLPAHPGDTTDADSVNTVG